MTSYRPKRKLFNANWDTIVMDVAFDSIPCLSKVNCLCFFNVKNLDKYMMSADESVMFE